MADTFGKGVRVRITEGDHEGAEGEIFWWGRSKFGFGMRAGVLSEVDGEKLWVDAGEIVAIDEEGNVLDPQPTIGPPPSATPRLEIRGIDVPYPLGRAITAARVARGIPVGKAQTSKVRLDHLRAVEDAVGGRLPDPVVAFVVSGLGSMREIAGVATLTAELRDAAPSLGDVVAFSRDDGDYLGFRSGAKSDDDTYVRFLREGSYTESVTGSLEELVLESLRGDVTRALQGFEVVVDYVTVDELADEAPAKEWVTHKKFGRGRVTTREATSKGDKLTIAFDDGETRKLLASFVEPAE